MTDSGFSSAASSRSSSSIIKPSLINSMSDIRKPTRNVLGVHNTNIPKTDHGSLPKPALQNIKLGRPVIPNRLLYGNSNGGYSPVGSPLYSFNESGMNSMSPMSSLALDFCDLNTSQENFSETPRRKLSLSSISSMDSPHPSMNGSGCFNSIKSPLSNSINKAYNAYNKLAGNANECSTPIWNDDMGNSGGGKKFSTNKEKSSKQIIGKFQRYKSLPLHQARDRLIGLSDNLIDEDQKENDPNVVRQSVEIGFSPITLAKKQSVSPNPCRPSPLKPIDVLDTHYPSMSTFSISPNKKRFRDEATTSAFSMARKRSKCSKSLNAKSAFLKERKTKSADAILRRPLPIIASSPISKSINLSRSVSAPPEQIPDDDDIVLSHSSLCSGDSDEEDKRDDQCSQDSDCFMDAICAISRASPARDAPSGLDCLIRGKLLFSNSLTSNGDANESMNTSATTSNKDLRPRELFRSPSAPPVSSCRRSLLSLKRPVIPSPAPEGTPVSYKRRKSVADFGSIAMMENKENEELAAASFLNRSRSASDFEIMRAVEQGCSNNDLVGDFSRKCTIPTVIGHHQDLKYISRETMVDILNNENCDVEIVDCRYTYEYEGGHIRGAQNIWTENQMSEKYFSEECLSKKNKRSIIVFHCEFSSERAPRMARALRNKDRSINNYPKLHYPEIYILHKGYKSFFQTCKEYCQPQSYVPMLDKEHEAELRKFRVKSKTWAGEKSKFGLMKRLQHHR